MHGSFPPGNTSTLPQASDLGKASPASLQLEISPVGALSAQTRAVLTQILKRTGSKAYAIYAISEKCAEDGDYTEQHNEFVGSLALELYEELQALGIRITE